MRAHNDPPFRHLSDGDLMRYLDGEGEAAERERWMEHAGACLSCASEIRTLREQTVSFSAWLAHAGFEAGDRRGAAAPALVEADPVPAAPSTARGTGARPSRRRPAGWLRAAAVLLLVAGPVAAVPSARQWVAERVVSAWSGVTTDGAGAASEAPAAAPVVLRFIPDAGSFTLDFEPGPVAGTVAVGRSDRSDAVFRAPAAAAARPVLAARSLRLEAAGAGDYTLLLPSSVTELVVRTDAGVVRLPSERIDRGETLELELIGRTSR